MWLPLHNFYVKNVQKVGSDILLVEEGEESEEESEQLPSAASADAPHPVSAAISSIEHQLQVEKEIAELSTLEPALPEPSKLADDDTATEAQVAVTDVTS